MKKTRFLKARLPDGLYQSLKEQADAAGKTISAFACEKLQERHDAMSQAELLSTLSARLAGACAVPSAGLEPRLLEVLLIVRELACDRNAQILARVGQQLKSQSSDVKGEVR